MSKAAAPLTPPSASNAYVISIWDQFCSEGGGGLRSLTQMAVVSCTNIFSSLGLLPKWLWFLAQIFSPALAQKSSGFAQILLAFLPTNLATLIFFFLGGGGATRRNCNLPSPLFLAHNAYVKSIGLLPKYFLQYLPEYNTNARGFAQILLALLPENCWPFSHRPLERF